MGLPVPASPPWLPIMESHAGSFLFSSGMTLQPCQHQRCGDDVRRKPWPLPHSFAEGQATVCWWQRWHGHESFQNAKVVVDDLGQGLCSWRGRAHADNLEQVVMLLFIHTHHKHGGISRRGRDGDCFSSTLQVDPGLLHGGEDTRRLHKMTSVYLVLAGSCSRSWRWLSCW